MSPLVNQSRDIVDRILLSYITTTNYYWGKTVGPTTGSRIKFLLHLKPIVGYSQLMRHCKYWHFISGRSRSRKLALGMIESRFCYRARSLLVDIFSINTGRSHVVWWSRSEKVCIEDGLTEYQSSDNP